MTSNLLAAETSPYLLQHKDNPVHWRPWNTETLELARTSHRPILLSVGYAACHWCHVMAHESFEDPDVAALMNSLFVNIKVDREERPDIDAVYQSALALMGEHGGWPLTMFLTPEGDPFWGGTYFPPTARYGRPAFSDVLRQVHAAFASDHPKLKENTAALRDALNKMAEPKPGNGLSATTLDDAASMTLRLIDPLRGGTAGAPKFPQPILFRFLWRSYKRTGAPLFRDAVLLTLQALSLGGIYDHLHGGFARYSTDAHWLVPHFEKMLYDNALLVDFLTEVWLSTREPLFADRVRETIEWALDRMRTDAVDGSLFAFASAFDADSEGHEGKYYVWTDGEIDALLGADAALFKRAYDVTPSGNWEGVSILNRTDCPPPLSLAEETALASARTQLLKVRDRRIPPQRDDKVLTDWNGLMIAALARAATAFQRPQWLDAARATFRFVQENITVEGRLRHTWCNGQARNPAVIDDYANMARAALVLYDATSEIVYLEQAEAWVAIADRYYWDQASGGYFLAAIDTVDLPFPTKSIVDNAVPSGNGTILEVLTTLHLLTGNSHYRERADALAELFSGDTPQHLVNIPGLLSAFDFSLRPVEIVIVGQSTDPATLALRAVVHQSPAVARSFMTLEPDQPLPTHHPAYGKTQIGDRPACYVCVGAACSAPFTQPQALRDYLHSF